MAASSTRGVTPVAYALAAAVLVLAAATAYRVVAFRDPLSLGVSAEGRPRAGAGFPSGLGQLLRERVTRPYS
jgi:hypothetical protein